MLPSTNTNVSFFFLEGTRPKQSTFALQEKDAVKLGPDFWAKQISPEAIQVSSARYVAGHSTTVAMKPLDTLSYSASLRMLSSYLRTIETRRIMSKSLHT